MQYIAFHDNALNVGRFTAHSNSEIRHSPASASTVDTTSAPTLATGANDVYVVREGAKQGLSSSRWVAHAVAGHGGDETAWYGATR